MLDVHTHLGEDVLELASKNKPIKVQDYARIIARALVGSLNSRLQYLG